MAVRNHRGVPCTDGCAAPARYEAHDSSRVGLVVLGVRSVYVSGGRTRECNCADRKARMFNVFLPKFLEEKLGSHAQSSGLVETLQEYCIYTFAG